MDERPDILHTLSRLVPPTIGSRMTAIVLIANLVVVGVAFGLTWGIGYDRLSQMSEETAIERLESVESFLRQADMRLSSGLARYMSSPTEKPSTPLKTLTDFQSSLDPSERPDTLVYLSPRGRVLASIGAEPDVRALASLDHARKVTWGFVRLASGPVLVAGRSLPGTSAARGRIVVSRRVTSGMLDALEGSDGRLVVALGDRLLEIPGSVARPDVGPLQKVTVHKDLPQVRVDALLPGLDGRPFAAVTLIQNDPAATMAENLLRDSASIAAIVAIVVGILVGLLVAAQLRGSMRRLSRHLVRQGQAALEGRDHAEEAPQGEWMARELVEFGQLVNDLLLQLTNRQTALRLAVRTAQDAEESFRTAINDSAEAKLLVRGDLIRIANPAATACLGMPAGMLLHRSPAEALRASSMAFEDGRHLDWDMLVAEAESVPIIIRYSRPGQSDRWLEVTASRRISDTDAQVLLTARDITEMRRVEQLRTEIVSIVSHDLRAPLTVLTGYLDLLQAPLDPAVHERALGEARRQAERMAMLLEDLLSATHAEELFAPKTLLPVPLAELAEDVARSLAPTAPSAKLTTRCDDDGVVLGEEKRLRQALVNLVTNAVKYSPRDSEVRIVVECDSDHVRLAVEDDGPGIPVQDRRRVFDRFTRLTTEGENKPGMGLGLYIVRLIAESHGGSVRAEEAPGGGARLVLELPRPSSIVSVDEGRDALSQAG